MNSFEKILRKQTVTSQSQHTQKASFTICIPNTNLTLSRTLNILNDLDEQDIFKWRLDFLETVKLCQWSEETATTVLFSITNSSLHSIFANDKNIDDRISSLLKRKYPPTKSFHYYNKLATINQNNFWTIKLYLEEIKRIVERLAITKNWSIEVHQAKVEETFANGLSQRCRLEMVRLNIHDFNEVYHIINSTEDTIIDQLRDTPQIKTNKEHFKSERNEPLHRKESVNKGNDKKFEKQKWCEHHKVKTHNTDECKAAKKETSDSSKGDFHKTYAVREAIRKPYLLEIPVTVCEKVITAVVDTGASHNYITDGLVEKLNIERKNLERETIAEMADGSSVNVTQRVFTTFSVQNDTNIKYQTEFRILPNGAPTILLGMLFLRNNEAIINLKDGILTLDGKQHELNEDNDARENTDNTLMEKTKIYNCKELAESKTRQLINEFCKNSPVLGKINNVCHSIPLTNEEPITLKGFKIPIPILAQVKKELEELIKLQVIRKSTSSFCSPAFPILKKNGKIRLVVDYRKLNEKTIIDGYPLPQISDFLLQLKASTTFSQIDLNMGYYQIEVKEEDVNKTAFTIAGENYEFLRMPFGLTNAPKTFQRAMNNLLSAFTFVKVFLDDILIHSENVESHYEHIKTVLEILRKSNISINIEKSKFLQTTVTYLGNIISSEGIKPDISRVSAMQAFIPKNKKGLQRLLGFINWFRPYIQNISNKLITITNKLKDNTKFIWEKEDQTIVEAVFEKIKQQILLTYPDMNKPFVLETDASEFAMGAVLKQGVNIIGFYSAKYNKSECNYTIVEKETLAILKALEKFKPIIFNNEVTIKTDNMNIVHTSSASKRIQRWKLQLEEFNYKIVHISGQENSIADAFSRLFKIEDQKGKDFINWNIIKEWQVKIENESRQYKNFNGIKIAIDNKGRVLIPKSEARSFLENLHKKLIHPGEKLLYLSVKGKFNIPTISKNIKSICRSCEICNKSKHLNNKYGFISGEISAEKRNELVSTDILGPIKTRHFTINMKEPMFYILTMTDVYSRWTEVAIMRNIKSKSLVKIIKSQWIDRYGPPSKILSDQGRQYISTNFKKMMDKHHITHIVTTPHNPTGNSISERINLTIGDVMRMSKGESIRKLLKNISIRINYNVNRMTGKSPHEKMWETDIFGQPATKEDEESYTERRKRNEDLIKDLETKNKGRKYHEYSVGQMVYKKTHNPDKVEDKWCGPFKIIKIDKSGNSLSIQEVGKISRQNLKNVRPDLGEGNMSCETTLIEEKLYYCYNNIKNVIGLKGLRTRRTFLEKKSIKAETKKTHGEARKEFK
ncbi:MAG: reverse transcriptase domain-containing protein [Aeromonas sp.]